MFTHQSLLSLGLLALLAGAGQAAESPFPAEPSFGPQTAVRLIRDDPPKEPSLPDEPAEETPKAAEPPAEDALEAPDMPAAQDDGLEDLGLEGEAGRDPGLAGQDTLEEKREEGPARAEGVLDRVDEILLKVRDRERGDSGEESEAEKGAEAEDLEAGAGPDDAEREAGRDGTAEGQLPGNTPPGKPRTSHGDGEDNTAKAEGPPAEDARQAPGRPVAQEGGLEDLDLEGEAGRGSGLAGQDTLEEQREKSLARAEMVLERVDEILLEARDRARQEPGDGGGAGGVSEGENPGTRGEPDDAEGNAGEEEDERDGVAEGQVPGDTPTGKTRESRGYGEDDDIVARQVCDLARQEQDPEVRKHLEEKCKSLRKD